MRPKLIYIGTAAVMLVLSLAVFNAYAEGHNRYHQHLEAADKPACTDHGSETFCTHLPLISVETDGPIPPGLIKDQETGKRISNYDVVGATVRYYDTPTENNHLEDDPVLEERATFRIRGASSRLFDKKGYFIKFKEEDMVTNRDVSIDGMTADSDWVLNGPYLDKTLIRNYICYNLSGEIMDYSPNVRFCELYLNGAYQGLYLLLEKIGYNDNGRVHMTETDPDVAETSYILQLDRGAQEELYQLNPFSYYAGINWSNSKGAAALEIVYPSRTLTPEQAKYIEDDVSRFEKAFYSYDLADPKHGYPAYIDTNAFVDYFLINEFTLNYDAMALSTYFYKDLRGKMGMVVWDFNSAWDYYEDPLLENQGFQLQNEFWYRYLFKDEAFVRQVVERYRELRQGVLSDEYLLNYIDETLDYLGPVIERNYAIWGYSFGQDYDYLKPTERNPRNYDQAIAQLKNCIVERGAYMDENIENLFAYSHKSVNKKYLLDTEAAS